MLDKPIGIFLSYVSEDKDNVRELNQTLQQWGFRTWFDEDCLRPGQVWDAEIQITIRQAPLVIVCISPQSNTKASYYQREIKWALDRQEEQPEGGIFTIPVKLEPCELPFKLRGIQAANLYENDGYNKLLDTLNGLPNPILVEIRVGATQKHKLHPEPDGKNASATTPPPPKSNSDKDSKNNPKLWIIGLLLFGLIAAFAGVTIWNLTNNPKPRFETPPPRTMTLEGVIRDRKKPKHPIPDVVVLAVVNEKDYKTNSNSAGKFTLEIPSGRDPFSVTARAENYYEENLRIKPKNLQTPLEIHLEPK